MKKILITTLLFLMSFTTIQAKGEVVMVENEREALIEVNPINVSSDAKSIEGFVARLYRLVLGREPDANGFIWFFLFYEQDGFSCSSARQYARGSGSRVSSVGSWLCRPAGRGAPAAGCS